MALLGGPTLRELRESAYPGKAGRAEFARLAGVSARTVEGWEASGGHVPTPKVKMVRRLLEQSDNPIQHVSNMDLIAELIRRLSAYEDMERDLGRLDDDPANGDLRRSGEDRTERGITSQRPLRGQRSVTGTAGPIRGERRKDADQDS